MCLGIFLLRFTLYWTYCISQTSVTISFPRLGKFPPRISPTIFSGTFSFSSSSETPIIWVWMCLMLSQRSLKLSSFLFTLYSIFCSAVVISTILSSSSLIHSSGSLNSTIDSFQCIFNFNYCVVNYTQWAYWFLCSSVLWVLVKHFLYLLDLCLPSVSDSLDHLYYHYSEFFSGRVLLSSSFIWSYGSLPCSFTCNLFHCCLILSNLLSLWSPFFRLQGCGFSFSSLPMVD